ncbi:hypothetical protein MPC4_190031 [Methylocella tundrae]|uniref:Uncharacterized protein n=1 Tax=Methylocella tundrae TaxID=227605 RepID=A0A8B6M4E7_METTU|nr:hypothetical protein MPC4_190031 [Methylocella tundrae]
MGRSCGGERTDGGELLRSSSESALLNGADIVALASWTPVRTRGATAVSSVGPVAAIAAVVVIALAHHRRLALFERFDADGQEADDVFVDAALALHLGDGGWRGVNVQKREMGLTILFDAIGEGLYAPVFDLLDLAAEAFDDRSELLGQGFHLLGGNILTSKINMLVESHFHCLSLRGRGAPAQSPSSPGKARQDKRRRRHWKSDLLKILPAKRAFRSAPSRSREGRFIA